MYGICYIVIKEVNGIIVISELREFRIDHSTSMYVGERKSIILIRLYSKSNLLQLDNRKNEIMTL